MFNLRHIVFTGILLFAGGVWASQSSPGATVPARSAFELDSALPTPRPAASGPHAPAFTAPQTVARTATVNDGPAASGNNQMRPGPFDLAPEPAAKPRAGPTTVFNGDYGLQGFMTRQWLTPRLGLSGGLGIDLNEKAGAETGDFGMTELQDKLLFAVGLTVAF